MHLLPILLLLSPFAWAQDAGKVPTPSTAPPAAEAPPSPTFPKLPAKLKGTWIFKDMSNSGKEYFGTMSITITSQDASGNAAGLYTEPSAGNYYPGVRCLDYRDVPIALKWEDDRTLQLTYTHPDQGCRTVRYKLTRIGEGLRFEYKSSVRTVHYEPE